MAHAKVYGIGHGSFDTTHPTSIVASLFTYVVQYDVPTAGTNRLVLTDASTSSHGTVNGWSWTVRDSGGASAGTSTLQNPTFDLAPGTYSIELVASDDQSATGTYTLSSATLRKLSGVSDFPNEPGTYTAVVGRVFNSKAVASGEGGTGSWPWKYSGSEGWDDIEYRDAALPDYQNSTNLSIVHDPAAPVAPGAVARALYPTGWAGGYAPINAQTKAFHHTTKHNVQYKKLYVSYGLKLSSNYYGHPTDPHTNKIIFYKSVSDLGSQVQEGAGRVFDRFVGGGNDPLYYQIAHQDTPDADALRSRFYTNMNGYSSSNQFEIVRGQWYHIEVQQQMNTPGTADGILRVWIDGTLVMEYTDVTIYDGTATNPGWSMVDWEPVFGGGGGVSVPADQYMWVDHIYASGAV